MSYAALSHVGLKRSGNEDAFLARSESNLFVVCDGLGGQDAGEVASAIAVRSIESYFRRHDLVNHLDLPATRAERALVAAIESAHEAVMSMSVVLQLERDMATTVVAALVLRNSVVIAHVGDSRIYLVNGNRGSRLTEDHSIANMLRATSAVESSAAPQPRFGGALTRAVGGINRSDPDTAIVSFTCGDRLLLCSDGLTSMVVEAEIGRLASGHRELDSAAINLIDAALAAGGRDNVTVVLVDPAQVIDRCDESSGQHSVTH